MRLGTFNIAGGRSLVDGRVDPGRLRAAIAALDVDVLALQEVDQDQPRSGGLDLTGIAAEAIGAVASRFAATVVGTPGEPWRPAVSAVDGAGSPRYGVALVSRWPVRYWRVRRLRPAPIRAPLWVPGPGGGRVALVDDEPRLVVAAVIETPTGPVTVACTHLSFVPVWNVGQLVGALRWLRGLPAPAYLLGDLNLPRPVVRAIAGPRGWRGLATGPTFPSTRPRLQLDHALARPGPASVAEVTWPAVPVSDHCPVVVVI